MNYALSAARSLWSNTVAVPKLILEQHLKFASARQLKALLYLLNSQAESVPAGELAVFLCCTEEEVTDLMEYWFASGIISRDSQAAPKEPPAFVESYQKQIHLKLEVPAQAEQPPKATKVLEAPRLTPRDIVNRGNEDTKIAGLLVEAQSVLCRTISHGEQELLVNMVDYYGLKPEVVLMILAFAKSTGKVNVRYISAMAKNWSDEGIDSVEQAEQKLEEISRCSAQWKTVCALAELPQKTPTPKQMELTDCWMNQWGFSAEVVGRAFEIAKDNEIKKTFPYVNRILENWHKDGIRTLSDLARSEEKEPKRPSHAGGKGRITSEASYDIREIEDESIAETLKFGG